MFKIQYLICRKKLVSIAQPLGSIHLYWRDQLNDSLAELKHITTKNLIHILWSKTVT